MGVCNYHGILCIQSAPSTVRWSAIVGGARWYVGIASRSLSEEFFFVGAVVVKRDCA